MHEPTVIIGEVGPIATCGEDPTQHVARISATKVGRQLAEVILGREDATAYETVSPHVLGVVALETRVGARPVLGDDPARARSVHESPHRVRKVRPAVSGISKLRHHGSVTPGIGVPASPPIPRCRRIDDPATRERTRSVNPKTPAVNALYPETGNGEGVVLGGVPCGTLVAPTIPHTGLDLRRRTREQVGARCHVLVEQPVDGDAVFRGLAVELNVLTGPAPLDQSVIL